MEFIGIWEELNNPNFKGNEFVTFKTQAGLNSFNLTPRKWIEATAELKDFVKDNFIYEPVGNYVRFYKIGI